MSKNFELLRYGSTRRAQPIARQQQAIDLPQPQRANPTFSEESLSAWLHVLLLIRNHWKISTLFCLFVVLTVATGTFLVTPVYEPSARIQIDPAGADFSIDDFRSPENNAEYIETHAKNLGSDALAVEVIRALGLAYQKEFAGDSSQPAERSEDAALKAFRSRLKVQRDSGSRLITVSFGSRDPQLAATITNKTVHMFVDRTNERRHQAIVQASAQASRQLDELRKKKEDAARALAEFQAANGIADLDDNKSTFSDRLAEMSRQQTQARTDEIQLQALIRQTDSTNSESLQQVQNSAIIQELTKDLSKVQVELAQASVLYGQNHPNTKKLRRRAEELNAQIQQQRASVIAGLQTSYQAALKREQALTGEISAASKELNKFREYAALRKEASDYAQTYADLSKKIIEAGIAAESRPNDIHIVDEARVLNTPTRPRRGLNLAFGMIAGVIGGVIIAFIREAFDNRLHTPDDIRKWTGLNTVAVVPRISDSEAHEGLLGRMVPLRAPTGKVAGRIIEMRPQSPEAEAMRALHTSVMLSSPGQPPQVILVASPSMGEGKTTVSVNLAIALSKHGPTCLMDADLRRPAVANIFGLSCGREIEKVLQDGSVDHALVDIEGLPGLKVLPFTTSAIQAGILCSDAVLEMMQTLRMRFAHVVIDSSPLLPFADARALSPHVDGIVLVGRCGTTTREAIVRSLELLAEVHSAPVLEVVINAADARIPDFRYYQEGYGSRSATKFRRNNGAHTKQT